MHGNVLVAVVLAVQGKQMVFPAERLARLVELAGRDTDILVLRTFGEIDELVVGKDDVVDRRKRTEETDGERCRGGDAAGGKRAADDAAQALGEPVFLGQEPGRPPQIVPPVSFLLFRNRRDMELHPFGEVHGLEFHDAILLHPVGHVDAVVQGEPRHRTKLVVDMGPERTDPVRTEGCQRLPLVGLTKEVLTRHGAPPYLSKKTLLPKQGRACHLPSGSPATYRHTCLHLSTETGRSAGKMAVPPPRFLPMDGAGSRHLHALRIDVY